MVKTYWQIGKRIVEQEQQGKARAEYGEQLIVALSRYLTDFFGKGFSTANLKNIRQFYQTFRDLDELATHCVANLSWSHLRLIMRLDDEKERHYYLQEASSQNWSVRQLERNIRSGYYRRLLSSQIVPVTQQANEAVAFIKDPYVLEFLNVPEDLTGKESILESKIISHLQKFLLELGKGFSFVARQMRISTETTHFFTDLVFYNYILKCFVIVDLKTEKLTHQDIGQMDMYVRMFDELKRGAEDNPTLGIILCTHKDEEMVKYSVLKESKQLFASKYKTVLPTEKELTDFIEKENLKLGTDKNKEEISIRSYKPSDARSLVDIFYNTIHKINSRDYTEEQINSWAPESFLKLSEWTKKWEKLKPFVAEMNNQIVGFAEFEDSGYIDCFYVHHEFQGKGIGGALMSAIYQTAETKNIEKIWADVSITAKPFFEKNGFIVIKEQLVEKRGSTLKNYKMEKYI